MMTENDEFSNLKTAYDNLIVQYHLLLKFVASGEVTWVTRQMIEDHIRVRIGEVAKAFTIDEWVHSDVDSSKELSWFRRESEYLTKLSTQLANLESFQRSLLSLFWKGSALLFSSAVVELSGVTDEAADANFIVANFWEIVRNLLLSFGFGLLILAIIFIVVGETLTRTKRRYLVTGYDEYGKRIKTPPTTETMNLYALENELFKLLKRKKPQEPPWDVWGIGISGAFVSSVILAGLFRFAPSAPNPLVPWAVGLVMITGLIAILGNEIRARLSRER